MKKLFWIGLATFLLFVAACVYAIKAEARSARFLVTAYCLNGHTATGTRPGWGTIAVDPKIIPLGSRLHVSGYGHGRALDTGGAVRGHHVDVWMSSCSAARAWGSRYRTVTW